MGTADQYASWIVANQAKKGTPEFETVAAAYKQARGETSAPKPQTGDLASSSIISGAAGLVGLPADALTMAGKLFGDLGKPEIAQYLTKDAIVKGVEKLTGTPLYNPESAAGRYAGKAIEGAVSMPGRAATMAMGAASGAGGEIGGDIGGTGGAVAGALLPFVAPAAAAKTVGLANDVMRGRMTDIRAGKVMRDVAGDKREQIVAALRNAPDDITAAQAAAPAESTRFSALGARAADNRSEWADSVRQAQEGGRTSALASVKPNLATVEAERTAVAKPLYKAAREGAQPVDTTQVIQNIDSILAKNPGNDELVSALSSIKKGLFDAEGNVRTNAGEIMSVVDGVKAKLANKDNKFIVEQLVGVKEGLKGVIPGAEQADAVFRQMSGPVNQSKVISALEDVLTNYKGGERVQPFLNVLGRGEGALLKRSTGMPRYQSGELSNVLNEGQMSAVNKVSSELTRDARLAELATSGRTDLANVLMKDASSFRLPNLLNRYAAIGNKVFDVAEDVLNKKTMDKVYDAMKTGKTAAQAMEVLPTSERNKVLKAMIELKSMPKSVRVGQELTQGE